MSRLKILYVCSPGDGLASLPAGVRDDAEVVVVHNPVRAIAEMGRQQFDGIYVAGDHFASAVRLGRLIQHERILEGMPDAVALLDADFTILWANHQLLRWCNRGNVVGERFFAALGNPDVVGGDGYPLLKALQTGLANTSVLKTTDGRYYQMHAAPISDPKDSARHLVVAIRDVTVETLQQQKLDAIQDAGRELADLKPDEISAMPVDQRIDMLRCNILHCTKDILKFDVVEIRLLNQKTKKLVPLLEVGMDPEAADRDLFAKEEGNGVTGFVAATGKSYLCDDTAHDPLYLQGVKGAKSSLTVPLKLHNEVIGTFNVESPQPHAFSESDLQFLKVFSRDVAVSLNTLHLLVAQQLNAAQQSVAEIHSQVALPIDEIVYDATWIDEQGANLPPETRDRLVMILANARRIKDVIQQVGRKLPPLDFDMGLGDPAADDKREKLRGKRVLVVDTEPAIRRSAHKLLEQHDCVVETVQKGIEAETLFKHGLRDLRYDAVIAGLQLCDMTAFDLMKRLRLLSEHVPLIVTDSGGYDPKHIWVDCRKHGVHPDGRVFKPFKERQLLDTLERIIDCDGGASSQA
ncbi:MAG: GAF domain-containing protein [Pirellulaceae bacterium]|nr:GAF domain-containing protein [Pirellulaceae bacterium]